MPPPEDPYELDRFLHAELKNRPHLGLVFILPEPPAITTIFVGGGPDRDGTELGYLVVGPIAETGEEWRAWVEPLSPQPGPFGRRI